MLPSPAVRIGVRHGWLWSAVLGAALGYSARANGVNSRLLILWLVLAGVISCVRLLHFAFDEPEWFSAQVSTKGVSTVVRNTVWGVFSFAGIYAVIIGVVGGLAYVIGRHTG